MRLGRKRAWRRVGLAGVAWRHLAGVTHPPQQPSSMLDVVLLAHAIEHYVDMRRLDRKEQRCVRQAEPRRLGRTATQVGRQGVAHHVAEQCYGGRRRTAGRWLAQRQVLLLLPLLLAAAQ